MVTPWLMFFMCFPRNYGIISFGIESARGVIPTRGDLRRNSRRQIPLNGYNPHSKQSHLERSANGDDMRALSMTESCKLRVLLPSTPPVVAGYRLCHSSQDATNVALRKPIGRELHQRLGTGQSLHSSCRAHYRTNLLRDAENADFQGLFPRFSVLVRVLSSRCTVDGMPDNFLSR
jgi:hypothetical protein